MGRIEEQRGTERGGRRSGGPGCARARPATSDVRARSRCGQRRSVPFGALAAALFAASTLSGCAAERTLIFTSEPSGALVRLDDDLVGTTPVEVPFLHYGTRRVTYYLEDHRTRSFLVAVRAPWYGRFPIDLVSEILIPVGWKDRKRVHTDLVPSDQPTDVPTQRSVFDRAEVLRRAGPNGPRELPPVEVVPALPPPPDPGDDAAAGDETPDATSVGKAPDATSVGKAPDATSVDAGR